MAIKRLLLTSGTTWIVPSDWTSYGSQIICIAGGASGAKRMGTVAGFGGGGGAVAVLNNFVLTPGQTVYTSIGAGGAANLTYGNLGGDTWLNKSSNAVPTSTSQGAKAIGGRSSYSDSTWFYAGSGGPASLCIGDLAFNGGRGGSVDPLSYSPNDSSYVISNMSSNFAGGGGGGSCALSSKNGFLGGPGYDKSIIGANGGGGGGGTGGDGYSPGGGGGGDGGFQVNGTTLGATGQAAAAGPAGTNGGGGAGGASRSTGTAYNGGAGGAGTDFALTAGGSAGFGGGGGGGGGGYSGGGAQYGGVGGAGGLYGGGGGGGGDAEETSIISGGAGAQGAIIVIYSDVLIAAPTNSNYFLLF